MLHKNSDNGQPISSEPLPKRKTFTGYCIFKILTIVYSIFYVLIGLALLGLGIYVIILKKEYESINDIVSSPAILCLVVSLIIVISAIVGCVSAALGRLWPLRIFLGIVIVVFIVQVVIGILAYVYREEAIGNLGNHLRVAVERYHVDSDVSYAVDRIQQKGTCCGFKSYKDWEENPRYKCSANTRDSCGVPDSCCKTIVEDCGRNVRRMSDPESLNNRGCEISLLNYIEKHLDILGATALSFAILHILGIFVVYMLITKIEDRIRLFKYRKRFYQS